MRELRRQFNLLRDRRPTIAGEVDEDVFPLWVLLATVSSDEHAVVESLTGARNDGGMDAILVANTGVWIVQGKLRGRPGGNREPKSEVEEFAAVAKHVFESPSSREVYWEDLKLNPRGAYERFSLASQVARTQGRPVHLIYASTGGFTRSTEQDCTALVRRYSKGRADITLLGPAQLGSALTNYIRDVAPAVPNLSLLVVGGEHHPQDMGDPTLRTWTLATTAAEVARLYREGGEQIFARNIRLDLGDKAHVNSSIAKTLAKEPHRFWILNNGLTVACESAVMDGRHIHLKGTQVINGQQTTRTIARALQRASLASRAAGARVSVRIIEFGELQQREADGLVARVVEATNLQNAITKADLRSNDVRQVEIMRDLEARGYQYTRRRGRTANVKMAYQRDKVSREDLFAAAVGAIYESAALREGQAPLFDPDLPYYKAVLGMSTDQLLVAWWCWQYVKRAARGNDDRQGAKWLVHYYVASDLRTMSGTKQMVAGLKRRDPLVARALLRLIEPYYRAAVIVYRDNRRIEGKTLRSKTYHQRTEAGANFARSWRGRGRCVRHRQDARAALAGLEELLTS